MSPNWRTRRFLGRPWQDIVFFTGGLVFLVSLIPLLFRHTNIPWYAAMSTSAMLYVFVLVQVSYRNWLTVCETTLTATCWLLIGLGVVL